MGFLTDHLGQFDVTVNGPKLLNVIDEFTCEALAIEIDRSIDAHSVVGAVDRVAAQRGRAPAFRAVLQRS